MESTYKGYRRRVAAHAFKHSLQWSHLWSAAAARLLSPMVTITRSLTSRPDSASFSPSAVKLTPSMLYLRAAKAERLGAQMPLAARRSVALALSVMLSGRRPASVGTITARVVMAATRALLMRETLIFASVMILVEAVS